QDLARSQTYKVSKNLIGGFDSFLKEAIYNGAVKRIRPKIMTATAIIAGLLPILWSSGTGADVMKRIAAPMAGGVVTSVLLELLVYPVIYYIWKQRQPSRQDQRYNI